MKICWLNVLDIIFIAIIIFIYKEYPVPTFLC